MPLFCFLVSALVFKLSLGDAALGVTASPHPGAGFFLGGAHPKPCLPPPRSPQASGRRSLLALGMEIAFIEPLECLYRTAIQR